MGTCYLTGYIRNTAVALSLTKFINRWDYVAN